MAFGAAPPVDVALIVQAVSKALDGLRALMADRMKAGVTILLLLGLGWTQAGAFEAPRRGLGAGPVEVLAIDPHTPTTIYAVAACGGAWKSIDGGDSWSTANSGLSEFVYDSSTQLLIDPATPRILYIRAHSGLFKSTNAGDSWQAAGGDLRPKVFLHRINHRTGDPRHALRRRRRRHQRPDQRRVQEHGRREQLATGAQRLCRSAVSHRAARRRPARAQYALCRRQRRLRCLQERRRSPHLVRCEHRAARRRQRGPCRRSTIPTTLYLQTGSGIFKSTDGAATWRTATPGLSYLAPTSSPSIQPCPAHSTPAP